MPPSPAAPMSGSVSPTCGCRAACCSSLSRAEEDATGMTHRQMNQVRSWAENRLVQALHAVGAAGGEARDRHRPQAQLPVSDQQHASMMRSQVRAHIALIDAGPQQHLRVMEEAKIRLGSASRKAALPPSPPAPPTSTCGARCGVTSLPPMSSRSSICAGLPQQATSASRRQPLAGWTCVRRQEII